MNIDNYAARCIRQYKNHTGTINGVHYKRIGHTMMYVFTGNGFTTPSRFRLVKGTWVLQSGPRQAPAVVESLPV